MLRLYPRGSKRNLAMAGIATILMTSTAIPTLVHAGDSATLTQIKHVIIIIGENRTFDHIFAHLCAREQGRKSFELAVARNCQCRWLAGAELWRRLAI